jgi:hypothetical protein
MLHILTDQQISLSVPVLPGSGVVPSASRRGNLARITIGMNSGSVRDGGYVQTRGQEMPSLTANRSILFDQGPVRPSRFSSVWR